MRVVRVFVWVVGGAAGCADDRTVLDEVELESQCGRDGPVRLAVIGDAEVVTVVQPFDAEHLRVSIGDGASSTRVVIASLCGGPEQPVAADVSWVSLEGDSLLGCRQDALVHLDDLGDSTPTVLAQRGCVATPTPYGRVAVDHPPGEPVARALLVRADGDGGVLVDILLDDILMPGEGSYGFSARDDEMFFRRSDASLWHVDLATRATTLILDDVLEHVRSPQFIVYRPIDDTPDDGESAVILYDRGTGEERIVLDAYPEWLSIDVTDDVVALGLHGSGPPQPPQWFHTADLRPIVPPQERNVQALLRDGHFLVSSYEQSTGTTFAWWREGESPEVVHACRDCQFRVTWALDGVLFDEWRGGNRVDVRFAAEGSAEVTHLAGPVHDSYQVTDDLRVLAVGSMDAIGPLTLSDHRDGSIRTVAPRVEPDSISLTRYLGGGVNRDVVYVTDEPKGERALYYAKLARLE